MRNVRIAYRSLLKNTGLTLAIGLLLAAIIAGSACVFTVGYSALYKELPYPTEQHLATLTSHLTKLDVDAGWSVPYLATMRRETRTLDSVVGYTLEQVTLADDNGRYADTAKAILAEPALFRLLGAPRPTLGRLLVADDTKTDAPPRVVIGSALWKNRFNGSRSVLERSLRIDGRDHRVVGVLAEGFAFPQRDYQIWLPLGFTEAEHASSQVGEFLELRAVGRLKPGQSMFNTSAEMMRLARSDPALEHMAELTGLELRAQPLRDLWVGERELSLKLMVLGILLVLVVVAANAGNLYSFAHWKRWEDPPRSTSQMLCEVALLCTAAGAIGAVLVPLGLLLLRHFDIVPVSSPQAIGGDVITAVFVVAAVVVVAAVMTLSGLVFQRRNAYKALRQGDSSHAARYGAKRLRGVLLMGQLTLGLIILISAVQLGSSAYSDWLIKKQDLGFERTGSLVGRLEPFQSPNTEDLPRQRAALAAWMAAVSSMPEVDSVGFANSAPFGEDVFVRPFNPPGAVSLAQESWPRTYVTHVSPQYFRALGLPIVRGRAFEEGENREGAHVAIVDADIAETYFSGAEPIGKTLSVSDGRGESPIEVEVVGVAAVARQRVLESADEYPTLYRPEAVPYRVHNITFDAVEVLVRTHGAPTTALVDALQAHLARLAPDLRFTQLITMKQRIANTSKDQASRNVVLLIMSVAAILLASIGIGAAQAYRTSMEFYERIGVPQALEYELGERALLITLVIVFGLPPIFLLGLVMTLPLYGPGLFAPLLLLGALVLSSLFSVLGLVVHWRRAYRGSEASWLKPPPWLNK